MMVWGMEHCPWPGKPITLQDPEESHGRLWPQAQTTALALFLCHAQQLQPFPLPGVPVDSPLKLCLLWYLALITPGWARSYLIDFAVICLR